MNAIQKTRAALTAAAFTAAGAANAAAVNVADVVTDIAAQSVPIALVGAAVLVLIVGVKAFKWVRSALS